ncbi:MAG TPA: exosortase/archaeosortase family protein [Campylobacterales bacterium]|nr:exosortase/archaeosortase family protein [Campylobacterales bacterium]
MKKFTLHYLLTLLILFTLFYWEASPIAYLINNLQIDLTSYLTAFTLSDEMMQENKIWINPMLLLIIDKACNGFIPYFFFLASVIAFPTSIIHKLKWALIGYVVLSLLNVFRIWFISQLVMLEESHFALAHDVFGNLFLLIGGLGLFVGFVKTSLLDTK